MTRHREAARAAAVSERGIRRARLAGAALLSLRLGILGLSILGLSILGLGALWAPPALAQLCPRPGQAPKVTVTAKPGALRLDRSLDDKALTALVQKLERNMHLTRGRPLGLTVGPISARYRTAIRYRKHQHGGYCVWLSGAQVSVGFEALTVYLDRAYQEGSCEYAAILAHEMTHVRLNREIVKKYLPQLRRVIANALRAKPSIRVLGVKRQARDAYLLYLKRRLARTLRAMEAQRRRQNAGIDTPESYRAIREKCANW